MPRLVIFPFLPAKFLLALVKDIGQVATAAVLPIVVGSHENAGTALGLRALPPQTLNLAITVNLVVLEDRELGLLPLVLDLLRGSVDLLLALLGTTTETEDEMESRLFLDIVVGKCAAIFKLLSGEDEALLVWRDALLICNIVRWRFCGKRSGASYLGSWTSHCRWYRKTPPQG
jgi:hypothetical protein